MTLNSAKKTLLTALCLGLAGCSGAGGDRWPSLSQGFETRSDPSNVEMQSQPQLNSENVVSKVELSAEVLDKVASLQSDIAKQRQKYQAAMVEFNGAEASEKQRHWFSAQLELTRISALKTSLLELAPTGVGGFLEELDAFLDAASKDLMLLKP